MPTFRDLRAWQLAKDLAVKCAKAARAFPGGERHPLAEQLLRACFSVPLNIAEGCGRRGPREMRRYLDIARGSLLETESAIEIARELEYVNADRYQEIMRLTTETGKTLWGLLRQVSMRARSHV